MKRTLYYIICLLSGLAMASCSSDDFKVDIEIRDFGTRNLRVLYADGDQVVDTWANTNEGQLRFKGEASGGLTVLFVYQDNNSPLFFAAVKNGEKIKVRGSVENLDSLEITGSKATEEWHKFMREHQSEINNPDALRKSIETYINENPKSVVSTLLLVMNYPNLGDTKSVAPLLEKIAPEAKSKELLTTYNYIKADYQTAEKERFPLMTLYSSKSKWETINLFDNSYTAILFWRSRDSRSELIDSLKSFKKRWNRVGVVGINFDPDSTTWQSAMKRDSVSWNQFWTPSGPMDENVEKLKIMQTPCLLIVDSVGLPHYRGKDPAEAYKVLKSKKFRSKK